MPGLPNLPQELNAIIESYIFHSHPEALAYQRRYREEIKKNMEGALDGVMAELRGSTLDLVCENCGDTLLLVVVSRDGFFGLGKH